MNVSIFARDVGIILVHFVPLYSDQLPRVQRGADAATAPTVWTELRVGRF